MKRGAIGLALVVAIIALLGAGSQAQPPGKKDGPPPFGKKGPPSSLVRAVDELRLSESQRQTVVAAVRDYEDDGRRLADMAGAHLLLKLKEILSPDEFAKVRESAERARGGPERLNVDSIVEHFMTFDKNNKGKISKDELPERMQDLFAKGDLNKDGFLDKDEIKKLAAEMAKEQPVRGGGFARPGPGGPRGRGVDRGLSPAAIERAVNDLKFAGKTKDAADAAIKANQADLRKLTEFARGHLLLTMSETLSADECKKLEAALDRQPTFGDRPFGRPPFGPDRPPPKKDN
jgi:hypothetical protein